MTVGMISRRDTPSLYSVCPCMLVAHSALCWPGYFMFSVLIAFECSSAKVERHDLMMLSRFSLVFVPKGGNHEVISCCLMRLPSSLLYMSPAGSMSRTQTSPPLYDATMVSGLTFKPLHVEMRRCCKRNSTQSTSHVENSDGNFACG